MNKKEREIKETCLEVLKRVLDDFNYMYTWQFKNKLKRSINKLEGELI